MTPKQRHREAVLRRDRDCQLSMLGPCGGRLQAHHVIPVQRIKVAHSLANADLAPRERHPLRGADERHPLLDADLDAIIADPANGVALCEVHHRAAEKGKLPASVLPGALFVFAETWGLTWSLERDGFVEREAA